MFAVFLMQGTAEAQDQSRLDEMGDSAEYALQLNTAHK
jgi:hypothetical protein